MSKKPATPEPEQVLVNKDSLDAMAENIQKIAKALDGAYGSAGQLSEEALITLLAHKLRSVSINRTEIGNVLWAIRNLADGNVVKRKTA